MKWEDLNPMVRRAGHIIAKNDSPSAPRKIYDHVLYYCQRGTARFCFSSGEKILEEGMFILIPPDTSHTIIYEGEETFGLLWCHFDFTPREDQNELDRYLRASYFVCLEEILPRRELLRPPLDLTGAPSLPLAKESRDRPGDSEHMTSLVTSYIRGEEEWRLIGKIHLLPLLYYLLKDEDSMNNPVDEKNPLVGEIIRYLDVHYDQPVTLKHLSDLFSYHEDYLGRLFRQETGIGFRDYLNRLRVEKSLGMLSGGSVLEEIAGQTGFCDAFYYSKVFKKVMGMSPSRWRER